MRGFIFSPQWRSFTRASLGNQNRTSFGFQGNRERLQERGARMYGCSRRWVGEGGLREKGKQRPSVAAFSLHLTAGWKRHKRAAGGGRKSAWCVCSQGARPPSILLQSPPLRDPQRCPLAEMVVEVALCLSLRPQSDVSNKTHRAGFFFFFL